jgi:WD40 repeat protein
MKCKGFWDDREIMILYKKIALFHVQYASGEISLIAVWNLDQEQLVSSIPLHSESGVSALAASQLHGAHFLAGCGDGSVRVFDIRSRRDM